MIAHTLRQGTGAVHMFTGEAPTTRTDGTPLAPEEISHYVRTVTSALGTEEMIVNLVAGAFSEPVAIDAVAADAYTYTYRTVDVNGLESVESEAVLLDILPPLAPPNPPIVLG